MSIIFIIIILLLMLESNQDYYNEVYLLFCGTSLYSGLQQ